MYLLPLHSLRSGNSPDYFLTQPQLPFQRRCLLRLDIGNHGVQTDFEFAPRNAIWIRRDVPSPHPTSQSLSNAAAQTIHDGRDAELDVRNPRRSTGFEFQNDAINSTHPPLGTI